MDAPEPPNPPPSKGKGVFKGKKKRTRSLSYNPKKRSNNQKAAPRPPRDDTTADDASDVSIRPVNEHSSTSTEYIEGRDEGLTYKYKTKAELEDMLRLCERELVDARVLIEKKEKTIKSLHSKHNKLVERTQLARISSREAKQYAKGVEEDAARSLKLSRDEVAAAEERERERALELKAKETAWRGELEKVKEVEQVSFIVLNMIAYIAQ